MEAAVNLKSLQLKGFGRGENESEDAAQQALFGRVRKAVRSDHLQDVSIYDMALREEDLTAFLTAHCRTLRAVKLFYVAIWDWDGWRTLLHGIGQGLTLERLNLIMLMAPFYEEEDDAWDSSRGVLSSDHMGEDGSRRSFHFTSADAVKVGVQRLCQTGEYS